MRVLIACEFSGIVRDAFIARGHNAVSCDFIETERPGPHYQGDVRDVLDTEWDLMIAHPPCQYLANAGLRWINTPEKKAAQEAAIAFVQMLLNAPIPKICIENPVGILSTAMRKPDQIINPWQFGHPEKKRTCLWYKNLVFLTPTNVLPKRRREAVVHRSYVTLDRNRAQERSRTYQGIANAMAQQWG